ncbi:MAG: alpha-ketoglutarate transporter, partial [Nonomuraea sp.]|nr:alpha-ketoglutarate transporter [Nonomuraea sp.]
TAEYVALWFKGNKIESGFFWYVSACAAVSLIVYLTMRETRDVALSRSEGAGTADSVAARV